MWTIGGIRRDELISHLEQLFKDGMSWGNIDKWHVDHIIPRVMWEYQTTEDSEFKQCWALANLQPLWAEDNVRKGKKIV